MCADEIGGGRPGRQAIGLRHVADPLADLDAVGAGIEAEHGRLAVGRIGQAEQCPDKRRLAGAVRAEQADAGAGNVEGQVAESSVPPEAFGQIGDRDDRSSLLTLDGRQRRVEFAGPRWSILGVNHA